MLRKVAIIYFVIEFISFGFLLVEDIEVMDLNNIQPWGTWLANILGYLAIISYGLGRTLFPQKLWLFIMMFYIGIRCYELYPFGLVPVDTDLYLSVIISLRYAYFVAPSILCLYYFCFNKDVYKSL